MKNNIKVSVIVPVYNVEEYIDECMETLLNQTLQDIQIICVNDGSTDNCQKILENYASKDSRITVISQENQGQGAARNNALDHAKGEYIGFVDPDDFVKLDMFEILYQNALENDADISECTYYVYENSTGKMKEKKINVKEENFPMYLFEGYSLMPCLRIYKKDMIDSKCLRFAPNTNMEDAVFVIDAMLSANKRVRINDCLYYYRIRKNSATTGVLKNFKPVFDNICSIEEIISKHGASDKTSSVFSKFKINALITAVHMIAKEDEPVFLENARALLGEDKYKIFLKKSINNNSFIENIFSVKNKRINSVKYKEVTLLGMKFILKK